MMLGLLPFPALTGQSMLLVLVAVLVAVVISITYGASTSRPSVSYVVLVVDGPDQRPAYVRLSDPSAAGRPRPRAPSACSTSA